MISTVCTECQQPICDCETDFTQADRVRIQEMHEIIVGLRDFVNEASKNPMLAALLPPIAF